MASVEFPHPEGDVSVVIVTYREREVLRACLRSFERFRPARVGEIVVVDNTEERERPTPGEEFQWIVYDASGRNLHFRRGVNRGARRASRRYVFILNPDTYLTDSDSIAKLAEMLDSDTRVGFAGPRMAGDDGLTALQGERLAGLADLVAAKTYLNALWPKNPIVRRQRRTGASREVSGQVDTLSAGALLCRREQFLAVGGFDERATIYWEEQELARKLRRLGLHGYYRADAFVYHSWRKGGTEHDAPAESQRYFDEAMRLYYREFHGRLGRLLFDALDAVQRLARRMRRWRTA